MLLKETTKKATKDGVSTKGEKRPATLLLSGTRERDMPQHTKNWEPTSKRDFTKVLTEIDSFYERVATPLQDVWA
jgi:hypothetical protein